MAYPIQWASTRENGLRVLNSPVSPITGPSSLLLYSDGTEWNATDLGLRKSASVFIHGGSGIERGFSEGRLRTLIRRNNATSQADAWGGIFIYSEIEGIGLRLSPGQTRYEITDKNGTIRILKYTGGLPTTVANSASTFAPNTIYGFEVRWNSTGLGLEITVSLGTSPLFIDLLPIISYVDPTPHTLAVTEGLFVQTQSHDDVVSYSFDTTFLYQVTHI